jgi:hypothetical protein
VSDKEGKGTFKKRKTGKEVKAAKELTRTGAAE